ncbi:unnamed protein product [marine sediment metagenome]|uniref:Uncharacterized protein n=1 Tax=marine sediment metagenome TaxID=412755 RepID=X0YZM3_9ZZZZ
MITPITTIIVGLVLTVIGVIGLMVAFKKDRYYTQGPIPDGEISGAQFVRLPIAKTESDVLPWPGHLRDSRDV